MKSKELRSKLGKDIKNDKYKKSNLFRKNDQEKDLIMYSTVGNGRELKRPERIPESGKMTEVAYAGGKSGMN